MASEINIEQQLLSHSHVGKQIQPKNIQWISFFMALTAVVGSLCIGLVTKAHNKEQKQISQLVIEMQESLRKYQANHTEQAPDNIEIVLQDLTNQISGQKHLTKDLESLVVSELRPQVSFLLKELELSRKVPSINLAKQDFYSKELLTKTLSLAELYLSVLRDIKTTDNLLAFAEQCLAKNNDIVAIKLKETIAKDRQSLALVEIPDKAKIWRSLDELHANVTQYVYKNAEQSIENAKNTIDTNKVAIQIKDWRWALHNTWHELTAMIKVRRGNNNVESIAALAKATENLQRARLCLLLEQARAASFSGDDKVYNASIITAKNILLTCFEKNNELNNKAIAELDLLAAVNIKLDLPTKIYSFEELEAI